MSKIVVTFPESQVMESKDGFFQNCELINSEQGIKEFGANAYLVNEEWYNEIKNGNVLDKEYSLEEIERNLRINFSFPIC